MKTLREELRNRATAAMAKQILEIELRDKAEKETSNNFINMMMSSIYKDRLVNKLKEHANNGNKHILILYTDIVRFLDLPDHTRHYINMVLKLDFLSALRKYILEIDSTLQVEYTDDTKIIIAWGANNPYEIEESV